jgi:hypothetical protein
MQGMGKSEARLKVSHGSHSINQGTQNLDIGRDTIVSLEVHGIVCPLDLHPGHHLDLIVIMIEVLDHGNNFDDKTNFYNSYECLRRLQLSLLAVM